jgi:hypothetical protein
MSADKGTGRLRPNLVLSARRERRGWTSRRRAARELHQLWKANFSGAPDIESLEKALYRHETGRTQVRDDAYRKLYCLAYDASPQELFGDLGAENATSDENFSVRSHKLITAYIGPELVEELRQRLAPTKAAGQLFDCESIGYESPDGACTLYLWPFGSVVFHLAEELCMPNIATLAVWRYRSYKEHLQWATDELAGILQAPCPSASYVLSVYWMLQSGWQADTLDTALRLLCMPKTLLERDADSPNVLEHAMLVERSLLDQGFDHPGLRQFGIAGISIGYASWAGVIYHPLAEQRCLSEDELMAVELATQSLWAYCNFINCEVEQGRDPDVPAQFGWRFLRGMRSLLSNPRPQEIEQHRSTRNAIIETSGVDTLLTQAIETLRESEGRA